MKTLAVLSDTHGNIKEIEKLKGIFSECDYIIHLGDCFADMRSFYSEYGDKIYQVYGNCDNNRQFDCFNEQILEVEDCKILLTHGNLYGVKSGLDVLAKRTKEVGADICLYGHTHNARIDEINGIQLINPGSLSYTTSNRSFCYLVVNGKKAVAVINDKIFSY